MARFKVNPETKELERCNPDSDDFESDDSVPDLIDYDSESDCALEDTDVYDCDDCDSDATLSYSVDRDGKAVPLSPRPAWTTSAKHAATKAAPKCVPQRAGELRGPLPASEVERLLRLGHPLDSDAYDSDDSVERLRSVERPVKQLRRSDDSEANHSDATDGSRFRLVRSFTSGGSAGEYRANHERVVGKRRPKNQP